MHPSIREWHGAQLNVPDHQRGEEMRRPKDKELRIGREVCHVGFDVQSIIPFGRASMRVPTRINPVSHRRSLLRT